MLLSGKNAIITGCLRGIGKQTLITLAEQGANIWACAQYPDDSFELFCKELEKKTNVWIKPVYFDLIDQESIKQNIKNIISEKQKIDILINIAGFTKDSLFHMTSLEQMKTIFDVNFFSQILITQYITKVMLRQKKGSVINISSTSGLDGGSGQLAYSSSKAALIGATKTLSRELAPQGIRVNSIAPGVINTSMNSIVPEKIISERIQGLSMKRMGEAFEISNAIVFLASDLSDYITGQIIRVDGGMKS